jgi:RNA polymerase sigma factor (sigma-70 family)
VQVRLADDFDGWVAPHLPVMGRLAARLTSIADQDDVVQDALVRAWKRRETFDPSTGTASGWLLAIVADQARRRRTRARPPTLPLSDLEEGVIDLHQDVDLERAVAKLAPRQRMVIDLYYYVGLDVRTCAEVMACADGTVKASLHQARARLHELLTEGDQDA